MGPLINGLIRKQSTHLNIWRVLYLLLKSKGPPGGAKKVFLVNHIREWKGEKDRTYRRKNEGRKVEGRRLKPKEEVLRGGRR